MKKELKRLAKRDTCPDNYGFTNSYAVRALKKRIAAETTTARTYEMHYQLCWQYMFAGYPDSAIVNMENIPDVVWESARKNNPNYDKEFMTGLAHLRIGEQANCQNNHNEFSCIMPLNEKGQHKDRAGSAEAIKHFMNVLERSPDHYTARWLLNIAHMTLGSYPDGVPKDLFIDFEHYPQDTSVPYFKNVGDGLGVNTNTFYGGAITEDFNNDGRMDIFATSGDLNTNVELYMSDNEGGFHRHTKHAGLEGITGGGNCTHADYNNDGFVDIYIIRGGWLGPKIGKLHPNSLLKNNGDGTFTDVTLEVGLLDYFPSHTAAFGDYNNDGWLDLFVGNENGYSQLFRNDNGIFTDISTEVGIYCSAYVKGSYWGDFDNDGWLDLYVSVSGGNNFLYHNRGKDKEGRITFRDIAEQADVQRPWGSFPTFVFDYNNDGWLDIFVASYPSNVAKLAHQYMTDTVNIEYSKLYLNQKNGTFRDIGASSGLNRSIEAMGLNFGDVDNDGWEDFYVGTGYPSYEALMPNLLFRNQEGEGYKEVMNAGFSHLQKGHGICFADMDNDGDQDVYVSLGGFMESDMFWNMLLENPGNDNSWITLDLEGTQSNRDGIGSRIRVKVERENGEERYVYRQVSPGGSFGSSSMQQEIGLGDAKKILEIKIKWPSTNVEQVFENVSLNKIYKVVEGETKLKEAKVKAFTFKEIGEGHHHHH